MKNNKTHLLDNYLVIIKAQGEARNRTRRKREEGKPHKPERIITMRKNSYKINYTEMTITVTKSYLKEASIIGSAAYNELAKVRKDFPDFQIVQREIAKKPGKKTYGKLTYQVMEDFIKEYEEENAPAALAEFQQIKQFSQFRAGKYAFVKNWFLNRYKDVFKQEDPQEAVA